MSSALSRWGRTKAKVPLTARRFIQSCKERCAVKVLQPPILAIVFLAASSLQVYSQNKTESSVAQKVKASSQTYTQEGVSVEFSTEPVSSGKGKAELLASTEAIVTFRISDANRKALDNLHPNVWFDKRETEALSDAKTCREKIQSFLQPSFARRAILDLNAYLILALNHEPNISVIDPFFGFGGTKLYALVALPGSGEDWVMSADKQRLYVSVPAVNQVVVVDTVTWKPVANIDAGAKPGRLALQHDGRYLWIGNDDTQNNAV